MLAKRSVPLPHSYRLVPLMALAALCAGHAGICGAEPKATNTEVLGPFTGPGAKLHPDNVKPIRIEYYGTDLGFTYEHQGKIWFLFGDTIANDHGDPIQASTQKRYDDAIGSVDLARWNRPETFSRTNMPLLKVLQNPHSSEAAAIDPGHLMELFKTPIGGFSNGKREFGVFFTYKPEACTQDADCPGGSQCDVQMGYLGPPPSSQEQLTIGCDDGSPYCTASTKNDASGKPLAASGLCVDHSSSTYANTPLGRKNAAVVMNLIGTRDLATPKKYSTDHRWYTSKFMNASFRTVRDFQPPQAGKSATPDFRLADGAGPHSRVFIWGRPHFIGVTAVGRTLSQYFAYVDLPGGPGYAWKPQYFTGTDASGQPHFSTNEHDAKPVDMDSTKAGVQAADPDDIVNQQSIVWVPELKKWVMFFSGGIFSIPLPNLPTCGLLELFAGADCKKVNVGNGGFKMRTADHPWGPWSPSQDIFVPGSPDVAKGQYGPGGVLHHPDCKGPTCASIDKAPDRLAREYGYLYAPNIVEQWIRPSGDGVDVIWNASTWAPYGLILLRTHISR